MSGPNFTYSTNVPLAAQKISATQQPIDDNFSAIAEWFNTNHVPFNSTNYGKHNLTSIVQEPSDVDPTTLSTEMSVYCKSVDGSINGYELFYRYPSSGSIVQLTGSAGDSLPGGTGFAYINSNLLMKWGTFTSSLTFPATVSFPTGGSIPAFATSVYIVQFSPAYTTVGPLQIIPYNISLTSFSYRYDSASSGTYSFPVAWFAIGV